MRAPRDYTDITSGKHRVDAGDGGLPGQRTDTESTERRPQCEVQANAPGHPGHAAQPGELGDHLHPIRAGLEGLSWDEREWRGPGWLTPGEARSVAATGATRGYWAGCDWWYGRDGKYRPAGPGIQPLASRDSPDVVLVCGSGKPYASFTATEARVGRLRLYGDAIVVPAAAEFIKAYMEARNAI